MLISYTQTNLLNLKSEYCNDIIIFFCMNSVFFVSITLETVTRVFHNSAKKNVLTVKTNKTWVMVKWASTGTTIWFNLDSKPKVDLYDPSMRHFFYNVFIVRWVTEELCLYNIVINWQRTFLGLDAQDPFRSLLMYLSYYRSLQS